MADRAQDRLHRRYWKLVNLTKPHSKAVVAVARELAGFLWATLCRPGMTEQQEPRRRRGLLASGGAVVEEARKHAA
jgi:hypothetical protein